MVDGFRRFVRVEDQDMKDRVDFEGVWEIKFVRDRRDFLGDAIWTNKLMLKLLGRMLCLGGEVDVSR